MMVSLLIVSNEDSIPEVVHTNSAKHDVGVVNFMVLGNPNSNHSPEALNSWISSESADLLWLSAESWSVPEVSWSKLSSEWCVVLLVKIGDEMRHVYLICYY